MNRRANLMKPTANSDYFIGILGMVASSAISPSRVAVAPWHSRPWHTIAAAAIISSVTLSPTQAVARVLTQAPDTENGARTFAYVCSACHLGGYNQVRPERTLQETVLRENGMLAADAIEYQVINGKNRMPAFEGRLTEEEITDVAYYVVEQAQAGWNNNPKYVAYPSKYFSSKLADAYANAAKKVR